MHDGLPIALVIRQHRYVDRASVHARIVRALAPQLPKADFAHLTIGPPDALLDVVRHGASRRLVPDPAVPDDVSGRLGGEVLAEEVGGYFAVSGVEVGDVGGGEAVALAVPDVVGRGRG